MTPNGTINASIDATSCVLPDGTSFAAYSLNLPTRGNLQVTLKGAAGFAPTLILRDGGGHLVVSGSPIAHYSEAGRYTVVVNTAKAKQLGTFSLTSVFTPEAYTLCRSFPSIGTGQTISGGLSSASCKLPDQTSYDAYWITVYGAGTLTVTMTAAAFDSYVILRGNDGSLLTSADAGGILIRLWRRQGALRRPRALISSRRCSRRIRTRLVSPRGRSIKPFPLAECRAARSI